MPRGRWNLGLEPYKLLELGERLQDKALTLFLFSSWRVVH